MSETKPNNKKKTVVKKVVNKAEDSRAEDPSKRDFMVLTASSFAAVGACGVALPLVDNLNPSADVLALSSIEVDLSNISPGQETTAKWQGKPIFIRHRTKEEIEEARSVDMKDLKDPEEDSARVQEGKEQWLVTIGICTHLGCVPLGGNQGSYNGWFCPCHGSHYDTSGRIRRGPAPLNLEIPKYAFLSDTRIKIG